MKKSGFGLLLVLFLVSALVLSTAAVSAKTLTLKLGHGAAPTNPRHLASLEFAKWVEQQTKGEIKIEVFPSESLGSDRQMAEAVAMGALDLSVNSQGPIATYVPELNVVGLPFLFRDYDDVAKVLDGEVGEMISDKAVPKGFRILAYWDNGFRQITNSVRPITKPADLKGLKIRTPEDKVTLAIFRALGANPAPLAFGELYLALQQKVFDGQENPVTNIHSSRLFEVQKYLSFSNHKYESNPFIISEKTWKSLTPAQQRILKEGAVKYAAVQRKMNNDITGKLLEDIKKAGVKVNNADQKALRDATKSVYTEFEPIVGKALLGKVLTLLED